MFAKKKPFPGDAADQKLTFPKLGAKPVKKKKLIKKTAKAIPAPAGKSNSFALQAAQALAAHKK